MPKITCSDFAPIDISR